ncbi:MAG: hypothetical protein IT531_19625 [Burkholderiales bacterium]|nr:hypothetical protein [Burkholderiales bacterium]
MARAAQPRAPLALAVLVEELDAIAQRFALLLQLTDAGERRAQLSDLGTAIDRYVRLEQDVFYPVLRRAGFEDKAASQRHEELRELARRVRGASLDASGAALVRELQRAFDAHRARQESHTFAQAAGVLRDELAALALELDEVRGRMSGAYGV